MWAPGSLLFDFICLFSFVFVSIYEYMYIHIFVMISLGHADSNLPSNCPNILHAPTLLYTPLALFT